MFVLEAFNCRMWLFILIALDRVSFPVSTVVTPVPQSLLGTCLGLSFHWFSAILS